MTVSLEGGSAEVLGAVGEGTGPSFDPRKIFRALERAGFSAVEVRVMARGTVAVGEAGPVLQLPGTSDPLPLALPEGVDASFDPVLEGTALLEGLLMQSGKKTFLLQVESWKPVALDSEASSEIPIRGDR